MKSAKPKDSKPKDVDWSHTRKSLRIRYGKWIGKSFKPLSYSQLSKWCEIAGIIKPDPGAFFSSEDIEALDLLWVSVRFIPNLGLQNYGELLRQGKTLHWWLRDYLNITLEQFLQHHSNRWGNHLVFNDVLKRLRKHNNNSEGNNNESEN